jgi:hypothetical protein
VCLVKPGLHTSILMFGHCAKHDRLPKPHHQGTQGKILRMLLKFAPLAIALVFLTAQTSPLQSQTKGFSTETSAKADQYGLLQVTIRNKSKLNITAVHIVRSCGDPGHSGPVSSVGFDSILFLTIGNLQDQGIAPGAERHFDLASEQAKCPGGISVAFSDGHCEGLVDGPHGCNELLADRRLAYAELADIRSFVQKIPEQDDQYIAKMQAELESRRVAHSRNTREESDGRMQVLQQLKMKFPPYTTPPAELSTPTQTVKTLDVWMARLATNIVVPGS